MLAGFIGVRTGSLGRFFVPLPFKHRWLAAGNRLIRRANAKELALAYKAGSMKKVQPLKRIRTQAARVEAAEPPPPSKTPGRDRGVRAAKRRRKA